jgi:prolyl-tRNA synthetase
MKGVPLRIEIGPRDVAQGTLVLARRDVPGKEGKLFGIAMDAVAERVEAMLIEIQAALLQRATAFRDANIHDVHSYAELKAAVETGGWGRAWWAGSTEDEVRIKDETGVTIRCFPFDQPGGSGVCFYTGQPASQVALFARAY